MLRLWTNDWLVGPLIWAREPELRCQPVLCILRLQLQEVALIHRNRLSHSIYLCRKVRKKGVTPAFLTFQFAFIIFPLSLQPWI